MKPGGAADDYRAWKADVATEMERQHGIAANHLEHVWVSAAQGPRRRPDWLDPIEHLLGYVEERHRLAGGERKPRRQLFF